MREQADKSDGLQTWLRFVKKQYDSNLSRLKDLDDKRMGKLISAICPNDADEQNRLEVQYSDYCLAVYLGRKNEKSNGSGVYQQQFPKYCLAMWCRLAELKVERLMFDALTHAIRFDDNDWVRIAIVEVTNQFKSILSFYLFQNPNDKIDQKLLASAMFSQNKDNLSALEVALNNSDRRPKPNVPMPKQLLGSSEFLFEYPPTYHGNVRLLNKYVESVLDYAEAKKMSRESKAYNQDEALNRLRLNDDCRKFQILCQNRIEIMYPKAAFKEKILSLLKREIRPQLLPHYADTLLASIEEFHDEINGRQESNELQKLSSALREIIPFLPPASKETQVGEVGDEAGTNPPKKKKGRPILRTNKRKEMVRDELEKLRKTKGKTRLTAREKFEHFSGLDGFEFLANGLEGDKTRDPSDFSDTLDLYLKP